MNCKDSPARPLGYKIDRLCTGGRALAAAAAGGLDEMFWYNTATEGNAWADGMRQKAQSAGKRAFITLGGAGTYDNFT